MATARPTLQDLGRACGVSVFTASRAMRGGPGVSAQTAARVRAMAQEIGYVTNHVARALKEEGTRTVGVLTANAANVYYTILLQAISMAVRASDYQVLTSDAVEGSQYQPALETAFVKTMLRGRVSGVIVTYQMTAENLRALQDFGIPVVFVDTPSPEGFERVPSVSTDNHAGGWLAGQHIGGHGCRRWLFLGYPATWATRVGRELGFAAAAQRFGADVTIIEAGNSSGSAYQAVTAFLRRRRGSAVQPDALFATNEPLLHGALTALRGTSLRPGADIGVIGFDDFGWAPLLTPPVTVVDQRISEMGIQAAELLVRTLEYGSRAVVLPSVVLPPRLTVRRSCGCGPSPPDETPDEDTATRNGGQPAPWLSQWA